MDRIHKYILLVNVFYYSLEPSCAQGKLDLAEHLNSLSLAVKYTVCMYFWAVCLLEKNKIEN